MSSRRRRIVISYPPIRPDEGFTPLSTGSGEEARAAPTPAERFITDQIRDEVAQQIAGMVAGDPGALLVAVVATAADAAELAELVRSTGKIGGMRIIEIEAERGGGEYEQQEDEHQC